MTTMDELARLLDTPFTEASVDWLINLWATNERLKGWEWTKFSQQWHAYKHNSFQPEVTVPDTGNELADRIALTVAVLRKEMGHD